MQLHVLAPLLNNSNTGIPPFGDTAVGLGSFGIPIGWIDRSSQGIGVATRVRPAVGAALATRFRVCPPCPVGKPGAGGYGIGKGGLVSWYSPRFRFCCTVERRNMDQAQGQQVRRAVVDDPPNVWAGIVPWWERWSVAPERRQAANGPDREAHCRVVGLYTGRGWSCADRCATGRLSFFGSAHHPLTRILHHGR